MASSGRAALGGEPFQSAIEARSACRGFPGGRRAGVDDRAGATTGTLAAASRSAFGGPRHGRGPTRHFAPARLGPARRYRALRYRAADHARSAFGWIGCFDRLSGMALSSRLGRCRVDGKTRCTRFISPNRLNALQRIFLACQNLGTGGALAVADPITGRAPEIRRRQWDKTSEVPAV